MKPLFEIVQYGQSVAPGNNCIQSAHRRVQLNCAIRKPRLQLSKRADRAAEVRHQHVVHVLELGMQSGVVIFVIENANPAIYYRLEKIKIDPRDTTYTERHCYMLK